MANKTEEIRVSLGNPKRSLIQDPLMTPPPTPPFGSYSSLSFTICLLFFFCYSFAVSLCTPSNAQTAEERTEKATNPREINCDNTVFAASTHCRVKDIQTVGSEILSESKGASVGVSSSVDADAAGHPLKSAALEPALSTETKDHN